MESLTEKEGRAMNRLKYYLKAFGFAGGTIHQVSEITGCSVVDLLTCTPKEAWTGSWYNRGLYWDTNTKEHKETVLIPNHQGNIDYWLGVCRSQELNDQGRKPSDISI
jgi:hypothetical protein